MKKIIYKILTLIISLVLGLILPSVLAYIGLAFFYLIAPVITISFYISARMQENYKEKLSYYCASGLFWGSLLNIPMLILYS